MYSKKRMLPIVGAKIQKKTLNHLDGIESFCSGYENRTRIACVRGMCPNH